MKKKDFDCVEMKRKAQEKIFEATKNMTREEQLEYYRKSAERVQRDIEKLRKKTSSRSRKKGKPVEKSRVSRNHG